MKHFLLAFLLLFSLTASAAPVGRMNDESGFYAIFHNTPEECPLPGAALIIIHNPDGVQTRQGCWHAVETIVKVMLKGGGSFVFQTSDIKWGTQ